jgi:hypothetical protein
MTLSEELKQIYRNVIKDLNLFYEKINQYPLISLLFIIAVLLIIVFPHWQVSGINNVTEKVTLENQSRATLAQVLGGVAIGIGLYYTWRRINIAEEDLKVTQENLKVTQENLEATQKAAQENLKVAQEGQITERFTRAVDQLGNDKLEIRLGGIYALERIASESEKDHWPIMEILTAYARKNSSIEDEDVIAQNKVSFDTQAIITVIGRQRRLIDPLLFDLDIQKTYLRKADLRGTNLEWANLKGTNLERAIFVNSNLEHARLIEANLEGARFFWTSLERTELKNADLTNAYFEIADIKGADLKGADLKGASLKGAKNLTVDQLSKTKTLYQAELDPELEEELRSKGYSHLLDDEP